MEGGATQVNGWGTAGRGGTAGSMVTECFTTGVQERDSEHKHCVVCVVCGGWAGLVWVCRGSLPTQQTLLLLTVHVH